MEQPMTDDPAIAGVAGIPADTPAGTHAPVQSRQRMRDGTELLLRTWQPDPARFAEPLGSVLLVHGLAEHAGRYQHVADVLCGLGLRVRAHDLRGHGASGGARMVADHPDAYLDDLAEIYDAAVPGWNELPILLGHSMGGLIAARFATARVRPVRALVLSSPALALRLSGPMLALHRVLLLAPRCACPIRSMRGSCRTIPPWWQPTAQTRWSKPPSPPAYWRALSAAWRRPRPMPRCWRRPR